MKIGVSVATGLGIAALAALPLATACVTRSQGNPPEPPAQVPWRSPPNWQRCIQWEQGDAKVPAKGVAELDWSRAVYRLSRTRCYGACPIYAVSIYPDGLVEYEGEEHVGTCGRRTRWVERSQLERLARAFSSAQYLSRRFDPSDELRPTDQPSANMVVELPGLMRSTHHYGTYDLRELGELESLVDQVAGASAWTQCPKADGDCMCTDPEAESEAMTRNLLDGSDAGPLFRQPQNPCSSSAK